MHIRSEQTDYLFCKWKLYQTYSNTKRSTLTVTSTFKLSVLRYDCPLTVFSATAIPHIMFDYMKWNPVIFTYQGLQSFNFGKKYWDQTGSLYW